MRLLGLLLAVALGIGAALAQTPSAPPTPRVVPDTLAQRLQACASCHGEQGQASNQGQVPRIAGKPAGYLHQQLLHFRDGRRAHGAMRHLLAHQSDAYLLQMATHYAAIDLPYPAPARQSANAALLARGQQLVQLGDATRGVPACVACHGQQMMGRQTHLPGLLGLPYDYVLSQMGAWRTGLRRAAAPDCMGQIAKALSADDLAAVSVWLANQPVPPGAKPAAASPAALPMACGVAQ